MEILQKDSNGFNNKLLLLLDIYLWIFLLCAFKFLLNSSEQSHVQCLEKSEHNLAMPTYLHITV